MPDTIEIAVRLRCFVRSEGEYWVSGCPSLDVYSQAETADEAKAALREAVELWVESCLERAHWNRRSGRSAGTSCHREPQFRRRVGTAVLTS